MVTIYRTAATGSTPARTVAQRVKADEATHPTDIGLFGAE